jgi:uncharacterized protein (TIGR03437 family)
VDPSCDISISVGDGGATVRFAGLVSVGEDQFNAVAPSIADGGESITASYSGQTRQAGRLIAIRN